MTLTPRDNREAIRAAVEEVLPALKSEGSELSRRERRLLIAALEALSGDRVVDRKAVLEEAAELVEDYPNRWEEPKNTAAHELRVFTASDLAFLIRNLSPAAPDEGGVMVPREPTKEMIEEGAEAYHNAKEEVGKQKITRGPDLGKSRHAFPADWLGPVYRAMISAAPLASAPEKKPIKLHFTNEVLKAQIEQDGDDEP